jgi:RNA polymerase sigma factor (sigma-70 family)
LTPQKLRAVRDMRLQIESLNERIARLRSALESCTPKPLTKMPKSTPIVQDRLAKSISKLVEMETELQHKLIDLAVLYEEVERWLDELPPTQAFVVRLRYVDGMSWRQVARETGYSYDRVRHIHSDVLKKLCARQSRHRMTQNSTK